jgi:hypothetical protein
MNAAPLPLQVYVTISLDLRTSREGVYNTSSPKTDTARSHFEAKTNNARCMSGRRCTMSFMFRQLVFACILAISARAADLDAERGARKAMDDFMTAFNARDVQAWAATLNYPHVRFASNQVRVYNTLQDFASENADYPKRLAPWHHSRWESMNVIQSGSDKVHFAVEFIRYDASGKEIGRFPSLYIVTLKNGHWGIQGRSSFAP